MTGCKPRPVWRRVVVVKVVGVAILVTLAVIAFRVLGLR